MTSRRWQPVNTWAVTVIDGWALAEFAADGATHPTYRRGAGPGVIVIHELPGITPEVIAFAEEVVDAGFTVVMPQLFGTPGEPMSLCHCHDTAPGCVIRSSTGWPWAGCGGGLAAGAGSRACTASLVGPASVPSAVLHRRVRLGDDGRRGGRRHRSWPSRRSRSAHRPGPRGRPQSRPLPTSRRSRPRRRDGRLSGARPPLRRRHRRPARASTELGPRDRAPRSSRVDLEGKGHATLTCCIASSEPSTGCCSSSTTDSKSSSPLPMAPGFQARRARALNLAAL